MQKYLIISFTVTYSYVLILFLGSKILFLFLVLLWVKQNKMKKWYVT